MVLKVPNKFKNATHQKLWVSIFLWLKMWDTVLVLTKLTVISNNVYVPNDTVLMN